MATPIDFEQLIAQVEQLESQAENGISRNYAQALKETRNIIRDKFDSYAVDGELTFAEMQKYNRRKKLNKEVRDAMNDLWVENGAETRKTLRDIYKTSYGTTKELVEEAANQVIRGKIKREMVQEALQMPLSGLSLNERLSRRRSDIINRIQETISQGLMDNETYTQMSSRIKETLEGDYSKAMRIVRTEGNRLSNKAKMDSLERAKAQGVELKKYWINSADERVRDTHEALGDKYTEDNAIDIDEDFVDPITGASAPAPSQFTEAKLTINCRCQAGYIVVTDD